MRIEDFWTDVHAYYVTFLTINDAEITNYNFITWKLLRQ